MKTKIKSIEDMDLYEIMNLSPSASQQDIERAYEIGLLSYKKNSLAHYNLIDEDQREETLKKIKAAYKILSDPEKRREYDRNNFKQKSEVYHNSYFRNSFEKLSIEDGDRGLVKIIKNVKGTFNSASISKKSDP